ncbi:hypothetical protein U1Q18_052595 [Sarracenia purpurea var. burkii]
MDHTPNYSLLRVFCCVCFVLPSKKSGINSVFVSLFMSSCVVVFNKIDISVIILYPNTFKSLVMFCFLSVSHILLYHSKYAYVPKEDLIVIDPFLYDVPSKEFTRTLNVS